MVQAGASEAAGERSSGVRPVSQTGAKGGRVQSGLGKPRLEGEKDGGCVYGWGLGQDQPAAGEAPTQPPRLPLRLDQRGWAPTVSWE